MEDKTTFFRDALGIIDIVAAFVMVWATQHNTRDASLKTRQGRWALFRRALYSLAAIALFGLGAERLLLGYTSDMWQSGFQIVILIALMTFPVLSANRMISQDYYIDHDQRSGGIDDKRVRFDDD